eukprot:22511_1
MLSIHILSLVDCHIHLHHPVKMALNEFAIVFRIRVLIVGFQRTVCSHSTTCLQICIVQEKSLILKTMQFVREYGMLDQDLFDEIKLFVENDTTEFEESELYSSVSQQKFIDHNERVSMYKKIRSNTLFGMVDQLISRINIDETFYQFMLFKNDITYIKYSQGGFFKAHEDYLSITSNCIQEFTFILCIDSNCGLDDGGETVFQINDYFQHKSRHTITNGHALLFRKDIKHEGRKIIRGHKHILTMNLWGFNKNDNYNQQNIVITFNHQNDKRNICILPLFNVLNLSNTKLAMDLMQNDGLNIDKGHALIHYDEKQLSVDTFRVFKQIYDESYITIQQFNQYKDDIFRYGFEYKNLLIDFGANNDAKKSKVNKEYNVLNGRPMFVGQDTWCDDKAFEAVKKKTVVRDAPYQYNAWKIEDVDEQEMSTKVDVDAKPDENDWRFNVNMLWNREMYLCDNNEQLMYILDMIKTDGLLYVPFKIVFVEGVLFYGGGMWGSKPDHLVMQPAWMSVGELDHILFYKRLGIKYIEDTMIYLKKTLQDSGVLSTFDMVNRIITNSDGYYRDMNLEEAEENEKDKEEKDVFVFDEDKHYRFPYRLNEENRMVLNKRYYSHIIRRIKNMDLVNKVRTKLNEISYTFPQIKKSVESNFCNEDVYGNFNLIISSGFMSVRVREDDIAILEAKEMLKKYLTEVIVDELIGFLPFDD